MNCGHVELRRIGVNREITFLVRQKWQTTLRVIQVQADATTHQQEIPRRRLEEWSGMRESNPRLDLGKVAYYHYTNPAKMNLHL